MMFKSLIISLALTASQYALAQKTLVKLEWPESQGPYMVSISNSEDGLWFDKFFLGHGETTISYSISSRLCFRITDVTRKKLPIKCTVPSGDVAQVIKWN